MSSGALRDVQRDLAELDRRRRQRPLDFAKRLSWQQVGWALLGGGPWRTEWGPPPSRAPKEVGVILSNRSGKTTFGGMVVSAHATGRFSRWKRAGKVWTGAPSFSDSVNIQREHVREWLGAGDISSWRHRDTEREATLRTKQGWTVVNKSFDQDVEHWAQGKVQAIHLDEPCRDGIVSEARARLIDEGGTLLFTFTPLQGIQSDLYERLYVPFREQLDDLNRERDATTCSVCGAPDYGPTWIEVKPGCWVITAGMRDNAGARGGFLPDEEIDDYEETLLRSGRALEARVRVHGEWLDITEDRTIPADELREWTTEPHCGFIGKVGWIDPAYSAKTASCETCISIAGRDHDGKVYLIESVHGRWQADERERICLEVLERHGDPVTHVQRVPGDREFANHANSLLMRSRRRACIRLWPAEGPVPDKVTRANTFAPMVSAGQVHVRPEHRAFRRQAAVFSASYLRAGGACDVLDAGMGALMEAVTGRRRISLREANARADRYWDRFASQSWLRGGRRRGGYLSQVD